MMSKDRTTDKGKEAMRLQLFSRMMEYEKSIEEQDYISGVVDHFMDPNSRCETDEVPLDVITNDTPLEVTDLLNTPEPPVDKD